MGFHGDATFNGNATFNGRSDFNAQANFFEQTFVSGAALYVESGANVEVQAGATLNVQEDAMAVMNGIVSFSKPPVFVNDHGGQAQVVQVGFAHQEYSSNV